MTRRRSTPVSPPRVRGVALRALVAPVVALCAVVVFQGVAPATVFGFATPLPVPKGESAQNQERIASVACTSARACVAAGTYDAKQPVVVDEVGGRWVRATRIALPANASEIGGGLTSITCTSVDDCVAVGTYQKDLETAPMVVTERAGTWARAIEAPLPPNAATGPRTIALFNGVACSSSTSCVAVGNTETETDPTGEAFVDTGSGASWTAAIPPMPAGATEGVLDAVTCSPTRCEAVGASNTASDRVQPVALAEVGGTWVRGVPVAPPNNVSAAGEGLELDGLTAVSCPVLGSCVVGGMYPTAHGEEAFVAAEQHGTWGVGHETTGPIGATPSQSSAIDGIACSSALRCVAVGSYQASIDAGLPLGMTLSEVGGVWQRAVLSALPPGGGPDADTTGVACPTAASCTTVGWYDAASGVTRSFAALPAALPGRAIIRGVVARLGGFIVTIGAPSSNGGLAIETYQYSLDGGVSWRARRPASPSTRLVLGSLARDHRYRLVVRGVTEAGVGPPSNVVTATTG